MNRAQRRALDKQTRKKLTDEQYEKFKNEAIAEMVEIRVEQELDRIWKQMSEALIEIMRANRISQERIYKIVSEFADEMHKKYGGVKGEEVSQPGRNK